MTIENNAASQAEDLIRKINAANSFVDVQQFEDSITRDARGRVSSKIGDGEDMNLRVHFTTRKVLHKTKTYENGGTPVFVDMEFITISSPFNKGTVIDAPVNAHYQQRFRKEYTAWKEGDALSTGTALSVLNLSDSDKLAVNQIGIYSVEQLARIGDVINTLDMKLQEEFKHSSTLQTVAERYLATRNERTNVTAQAMIEKLTKQLEVATSLIEKQNDEKQSGKKKSSEA